MIRCLGKKQNRKRQREDESVSGSDSDGTPQPHRVAKRACREVSPSLPSKKKKEARHGFGSDPFHIKKTQLSTKEDPTLVNFKMAVEVHIHVMTGLYKADALPVSPTPQEIEAVEKKFKKSRDPYREIDQNMDKVNPKDKEVRKSLQQLRYECKEIRGGTYAAKIALIPDHSVHVILGMVKESGLAEWRPDILGVPDSFYNQLHKQAFMKCFEATVLNGGYRHLEVTFKHLDNIHLLGKLLNNYLFSFWRNLVKREAKEQGSVLRAIAKNKVYKRREIVRRGWNLRIQYLIAEPACHSEEEDAPDGKSFHVLSMPCRSSKATKFIQVLDGEVEEFISLTKKYNAYKRYPRKPHPTNKTTQLNRLPSPSVALDWHDPEQFNRLPAFICAKYIKSRIALPLEPTMNHKEDWQSLKMSEEEFMKEYGNDVRALYHFPTEEQIEAMKNGVVPDSDSSDEGNDDDFASEDEAAQEPGFEDIYNDDDYDDEEQDDGSDATGVDEREEEMAADDEETNEFQSTEAQGEEMATDDEETNESQSTAMQGDEAPTNLDSSEMDFESAVETNEDTEMDSDDDL
ncbi:hypothetical protein BT96DRAFT_986368 [Gymnopus androsaceus JB14]|uniref:Uncharacterized protein n=1 Tax=Gymnopus androsaceus JB14 TaxID=1447944 RepID=A0A6A4IG27_9AGAR|nr:hypothetical protein BT96DRAFT_986368 [Gymnopus androsaceus JB14]